ncbi:VWA domain-containing protein [Chloroflexota bacterium]
MFTDFFYTLRKRHVPVSITEWMTLMEALARGYITNLDEFYFLARAILVKSEAYYDHYDVAFQQYFKGIEIPAEILEQVMEWLKEPLERMPVTEHEQSMLDSMDCNKLLEELKNRLKEQSSQHDGGSYWIGRGGTSAFGHSGRHPAGIRIGGESRERSAIQIAQERKFRNYRSDLTLDVRQIKIALKGLRQLNRIGPEDELDLDKTIKASAKNAGELDFIWRKGRKNAAKLLLLMDTGGSMEPFAELCSQLFSAAHSSNHFKDFQYYYFHNCIYDNLYRNIELGETISTDLLLRTLEPDYKLLLVGDARMAPYELTEKYGAIHYYERNEIPGIVWLKRVAEHFTHSVWLNPDESRFWVAYTVQAIAKLIPMYPLSLDGLGQAVKKLLVKK